MSLVTTNMPLAQNGLVDEEQPLELSKPKRRRFSAEYKARIVDEYDALTDNGAKGALLRREGLYSSHVFEWRKARDAAGLEVLRPKKRKASNMAEQRELEALRRKNERLEKKVAAQQATIELAGKAYALLEMLSESAASNNDDSKK